MKFLNDFSLHESYRMKDLNAFINSLEDLSYKTREEIYAKLIDKAIENELKYIAELVHTYLIRNYNGMSYDISYSELMREINSLINENKYPSYEYLIKIIKHARYGTNMIEISQKDGTNKDMRVRINF